MRASYLALLLAVAGGVQAESPGSVSWQEWNSEVFNRARLENKFVLLELEAVWCHWCHVMDKTTYKDPRVISQLQSHYISIKVDSDARPDLAARYEDYGWPATVVFSPEGEEIVRLRGYQSPERFASILENIVKDPSPVVSQSPLPPANLGRPGNEVREKALERHYRHFDYQMGGFGFSHKFLNWDSVEFCLQRARQGDAKSANMARLTLDGQLNLVDPIWGGVYQYSTDGDWQHPHYEKVMDHQANNLRIFSLAAAQFNDPRYLEAADRIADYLMTFLRSPEGAFYTSQDADLNPGEHSSNYFALDDAARKKRGIPRIDRHCYARENGWAIEALAQHARLSQSARSRSAALTAAQWLLQHRSLATGGYRHAERDVSGPYLGDTLAAGRAFLALHSLTGEADWLHRAEACGDFIQSHFVHAGHAGLATSVLNSPLDRLRYLRAENIQAARFFNLLYHIGGREQDQRGREQVLGYLSLAAIATEDNTGGVLLADYECSNPPVHINLGNHTDAALVAEVERIPDLYLHFSRQTQPDGVTICDSSGVCSRPYQRLPELRQHLQRLRSGWAH